jgi:hypothetical protein
VLTQNQVGIDGVANTAWSLEDDDGAQFEGVQQAITIPSDTNPVCFSVYVLKDSDTSRYPSIQLYLNGANAVAVDLDTQNGTLVEYGSAGTYTSAVEDHGLWWRVILTVANASLTTAIGKLYPAPSTVQGTNSAAATGSAVFDQAQLELSTSVPSSPIITTTVAVTKAIDALSYDLTNHDDTRGAYCLHIIPGHDSNAGVGTYPYLGNLSQPMLYASNNLIRTYDGTTATSLAATYSTGDSLQIGLIYDTTNSKMNVNVDETWDTEVAYDGSYGLPSLDILKTPVTPMIMSDLTRYDVAYDRGVEIIDIRATSD